MKNVIIKTVGFLLAFSGAVILLSFVAVGLVKADPYRAPEREQVRVELSNEKKNTVDLVVLGDSESYTSFSPLQIWNTNGTAAYDCGQSGGKPVEAYYMLKSVYKKQSPAIVLLECNTLYESAAMMTETNQTYMEILDYYIPLLRYHDLWRMALDETEVRRAFYNGFLIRPSIKACTNTQYMNKTEDRFTVKKREYYYLDKIRELCKAHGSKLVLYSAPSPKNFCYAKYNEISDYATKYNLPYADLNQQIEAMGIDWTKDTLDGGEHMNLTGCQKTTTYLTDYLQKLYELPDHRGDQAYSAWDTEGKAYQAAADQAVEEMNKQ